MNMKKPMSTPTYPVSTIAKLFNLTERRVQQLASEGVIPKPERGKYDLVASVAINANRNLGAYQAFGVPVWPDDTPGFAGPLAGLEAGLRRCATDYLLTAPCDSRVAGWTPRADTLQALEYVTYPASSTAEAPGTFVIRFEIAPPVQDSAIASFNPRPAMALATATSSVSSSSP